MYTRIFVLRCWWIAVCLSSWILLWESIGWISQSRLVFLYLFHCSIVCCIFVLFLNDFVKTFLLKNPLQANWFCKMLKALNVYSSMATINWMFVEGFLFHRRLLTPFSHNTRAYNFAYYFIGWILPAVCVGTWSISLEFFSIVSDKPCWQGYRHSNTIFIVSTPMIVAVIFNFIFLINIIRILVTKLRAANNKSDHATAKAIKATALLIPLLGKHSFLHLIYLFIAPLLQAFITWLFCTTHPHSIVNWLMFTSFSTFSSSPSKELSFRYCIVLQTMRWVLNTLNCLSPFLLL